MKKNKWIASALSMAMLLTCLPLPAQAKEIPEDTEVSVEENLFAEYDSSSEALEIQTNTTVTGQLEGKYDVNWYKFTTTKEGYFQVWLGKNPQADGTLINDGWKYSLYDADNGEALVTYSGVKTGTRTYSYAFPKGKSFYVKVQNYLDYSIPKCAYDLLVEETEDFHWEKEYNNSRSNATPVEGSELYGMLYSKNDVDYFSFEVTENTRFSVSLDVSSAEVEKILDGWDVFIYREEEADSCLTVRGWKSKGDSQEILLTPGKYYICVGPYSTSSLSPKFQTYHLTLNKTAYPSQEMYRLYSQGSGEHFYTASAGERDVLVSQGWIYEGVGWNAPVSSSKPVYRLYNPYGGEHHYTTEEGERTGLIQAGWQDEGIGWYSDEFESVPLYRVYNKKAKANNHHYTLDVNERDSLVKAGWKKEGTAWYGL